jgi:hypothetical protein
VLLDGWPFITGLQAFDIISDVQWLDIDEPNMVTVAPGEEPADSVQIGPRVFLLRIVAAKYSRKRRVACSPASATMPGTTRAADPPAEIDRAGRLTVSSRPAAGVFSGGSSDMIIV